MIQLALLGKEYCDNIFYVNNVVAGETNQCLSITKKRGGCYNFLEAEIEDITCQMITSGRKLAFIISDIQKGMRTSFVVNEIESKICISDIENINKNFDWAHICYIDDIESHDQISKIEIPFSIDFCTVKNRSTFSDIMESAEIIFESRERKNLYREIAIDTPIIFHDEFGFEIIQNKKLIHKETMDPCYGLDVNGAGDIYAAYVIKNYNNLGIINSATLAMKCATNKLLLRGQNE